MIKLTLILARARNGVIGRNNGLPWRLPEDLAFFKRITVGHPVIMGRKTFESIGRPLPARRNLVVTRNPSLQFEGCECLPSLEAALDRCREAHQEQVFLIGGAELYQQGLGLADSLLITEINADFDGDTFFAQPDTAVWQESSRQVMQAAEPNDFSFAFVSYTRRPG